MHNYTNVENQKYFKQLEGPELFTVTMNIILCSVRLVCLLVANPVYKW